MPSLNSDFGLINGECSDLGFGRPILQSQNPNGVTIFPQKPNPALFSVKIIVYAAMISLQNVLLESPCAVAISGGGVITEARQKAVQAANGMAALLKLVISPSASVTGQSQTEAVYSPIPTVYKDVSLLPHVLDASVVMAHEIQRCHISPTNEAEPGRLVGSLELFRTLVIVLRDLGASDPSISIGKFYSVAFLHMLMSPPIGDEVQRLIGVLPDRIRALLDLSPLASMGHCGS
ncbi:uncharacterized protein EI90DRAFT_1579493 [Cantharellus anzutake]|uniref:uncharacterized protein n=1 Tax=Cantharellus anzutake TaxID=1750568 RepID=UPI001907EECC|nr:uncharacterized protein EI90DRAFT_1579493 [Cantharellus anzutake]KAF8328457.1 hypothetical protein EI90DRAFT_1579493 [Cantharellus anzutake]